MLLKTALLASLSLRAAAAPALQRRDNSVISGGGASKHGAVASEVDICSEVGISILQAQGNAADATIATGLCVGTINAFHSGIGGGGFMIVRSANGSYEMIDFRETMPAAGNETMYASDTVNGTHLSTIGGLAAGTPGELRGWQALHDRHGKLPWHKLFAPAIKLAREGFPVNYDLADAIQQGKSFILNDPLWSETYAPNGSLLVQGEICYRHRLANTLEKISWYGVDWFYTGETAVNTAYAAKARGGILTPQDLANYTVEIREPVNITYRDARIFSTVAPSSGAVVLSALKIFEAYNASSAREGQAGFNESVAKILEATQFGYGQRTQYGDPAFVPNVTELQQYYLSAPAIQEIRSKIVDNETFPVPYYVPSNETATRESGTSHIAVIDGEGGAVSLTTTVNTYWGSQVMTTDGVILNNEMDDFSSPGQGVNSFGFSPSPANFIRPGKRPQSSIASSIAEDAETGEVRVATGSAGGSRIITATLQYLHHALDQGMSAYEAAHEPRWHDQLSGVTFLEWKDEQVGIRGFSNATAAYLSDVGYNVTCQGTSGSTGHIIIRTANGTLEAASDPRKRAGGGFAF